jgi:hemolysin activation/secretion protein
LGDSGASGTIELQGPNAFSFTRHAAQLKFIPVIFFDGGVVRLLEPLSGQERFSDLRSAGAGFDFSIFNAVSGSLFWGDPLVSASHTRAYESRWQFSVRGAW